MRAITFIAVLIVLLAVLTASLAGEAQPTKIPRIGMLATSTPGPFMQAFEQRLRELGYVKGQNIAIEFRGAEGRVDRLPGGALDLGIPAQDAVMSPTFPVAHVEASNMPLERTAGSPSLAAAAHGRRSAARRRRRQGVR